MKEINQILESKMLSGFRATPKGHSGGQYVQKLEAEFRAYFGVKYAIALNSATAGLHAALIACGIGEGDEVIVSPYSFSSSASCVLMVGATPVFADIDPLTYCIDPSKVDALITRKTKAIIPVHLFGHPTDMDGIMGIAKAYQLRIIEDAAQAITATYNGRYVGTIGDCGIFSFNQNKHISTGEGGMLITDSDQIAERVRAVRNHGEVAAPELKVLGYNYRMCEIEAALALEQFRVIDKTISARIQKAEKLDTGICQRGLFPPFVAEGCKHIYYLYAVKDEIGCGIDGFIKGYVEPLYMLPIYQQFGYGKGLCPVTEEVQQLLWVKSML